MILAAENLDDLLDLTAEAEDWVDPDAPEGDIGRALVVGIPVGLLCWAVLLAVWPSC